MEGVTCAGLHKARRAWTLAVPLELALHTCVVPSTLSALAGDVQLQRSESRYIRTSVGTRSALNIGNDPKQGRS